LCELSFNAFLKGLPAIYSPGAVCTITVYWFGTLSLGQVTIVDASGIPQYVGLTGE
jgi:hypothetical protein